MMIQGAGGVVIGVVGLGVGAARRGFDDIHLVSSWSRLWRPYHGPLDAFSVRNVCDRWEGDEVVRSGFSTGAPQRERARRR